MRPSAPLIVGIAGGTGAGKSTIARHLAETVRRAQVGCLDLDSYYHDLSPLSHEERALVNFDHPDALDWSVFCQDLARLKRGESIAKPRYDFTTHTRMSGAAVVVPGEVLLVEGLMLFVNERARALLDVKVYIEAPADIRLLRRLERDVRERHRTVQGSMRQYTEFVRPMHEEFIAPTKGMADLVVPGWGHQGTALAALTALIEQMAPSTSVVSPMPEAPYQDAVGTHVDIMRGAS